MTALKAFIPGLAAALAIAAALVLLRPVLDAEAFALDRRAVAWGPADGLNPRRPEEGEVWRTLAAPQANRFGAARDYAYRFEADDLGQGAAAIMVPLVPPSTRLFLNNVRLPTEPSALQSPALSDRRAALASLPAQYFHPGADRIGVIVREARPRAWPRAIFLGPRAALEPAARRLDAVAATAPRVAGALGAVAALFSALAAFSKARRHYLVPGAALLVFAVLAAWPALSPPGLSAFVQTAVTDSLHLAIALFLIAVVSAEFGLFSRLPRLALRLSLAAALALAAAIAFFEQKSIIAQDIANAIVLGASLAAGAVCLFALAASRQALKAWTPLQLAAAGSAGAAMLGAAIIRMDMILPIAGLVAEALFVAGAFGAFSAWSLHAGRLLALDGEALLQRRFGLSRIVRDQERQLEAQQQALAVEIRRRAVLEERERFSRDMHDGIGGALLGLLLQSRAGKVSPEKMSDELERSLGELRLMIDALDHAETSLAAALSAFHTRVAPQFEAAGVALDWRAEGLDEYPQTDPARLLHLYRILQEACANVLKHGRARRASVAVEWLKSSGELKVTVEDDGSAATETNPKGKGLKNMARRAADLQGAFAAGPREDGGWRVSLSMPA